MNFAECFRAVTEMVPAKDGLISVRVEASRNSKGEVEIEWEAYLGLDSCENKFSNASTPQGLVEAVRRSLAGEPEPTQPMTQLESIDPVSA